MNQFQKPPTILFADDDKATLDVFRYYVASFGWEAEYVTTARDIIRAINRKHAEDGEQFDALVCDINYFDENPSEGPRISGVAAARAIREQNADLPIVFVSAYSSILIEDEITRVNAEMFAKPVDFEALFERLSWLIRWHRSVQPNANLPEDRRRKSINSSDFNRRKTDRRITVAKSLTSAAAEMRSAHRISQAAAELRTTIDEADDRGH